MHLSCMFGLFTLASNAYTMEMKLKTIGCFCCNMLYIIYDVCSTTQTEMNCQNASGVSDIFCLLLLLHI